MSIEKVTYEPKPVDQAAHVRALVAKLTAEPMDHETALVLADWCSDHGMDASAEHLKTGRDDGPGYLPVLASLRTLFGDPNTSGGETGRYTAVIGFPRTTIAAYTSLVIPTQTQVPMRCRRLMIPAGIASYLQVQDVKIGHNSLFLNTDPIPGTLFTERMPDTFDGTPIHVAARVSVYVENTTGGELIFGGALLGDMEDDEESRYKLGLENNIRSLESRMTNMVTNEERLVGQVEMLTTIVKGLQEQLSMLRERVKS
jgi:hypothetical protein